MQRDRHQAGGIRKQRGRWIGMWRINGLRKSRVIGLVKDMTKTEAREAVRLIVAKDVGQSRIDEALPFDEFVKLSYLPLYIRKWKGSTAGTNFNRVLVHLCPSFAGRSLASIQREELQELLDQKAKRLSYSIVAHLRWDMNQIFNMAVAEGTIPRNPALLLWTPREARKPVRKVMTLKEVHLCFSVLADRERLIVKLATLAGMRPGEIFALTWGQMTEKHADIRQRVYRGVIDSPKTEQSYRKAALSEGLQSDVERWRQKAPVTADAAYVFPSERMTPLAKENVWRRNIGPKLDAVGLDWVTFQVMRRTASSLMNALGVEGKLVADQLGHTLDVNQNVYTQSAVSLRQVGVDQLEAALNGVHLTFSDLVVSASN